MGRRSFLSDPPIKPRRPFQPTPPDGFKWTGKSTQAADTWIESQRQREAEVKQRLANTPYSEWVMGSGKELKF